MVKPQKTFITVKFFSMLCSGTVLMILTALMAVMDTLIAGVILGEEAVTGICLVLPVYSMASFLAVCISYGVPIQYAAKTGAFQKDEADRCFGVGMTMAISTGVLMFAVILFGEEAYLRAFHLSGQTYTSAAEYLRWLKYSVLLLPLNELLDGMVFADGDEKITLAANLTQGLLKIVLSIVLCRHMGAEGLALASLISFVVSVIISCLHFIRPGNTLNPKLAFSIRILRKIMKFGIVDASTHLFVSLFTFAISFFMTLHFGPDALILVSVITLIKEGQIIFEGIGEAITPIISVYLGEGTWPGVRKVWKLAQWSGRIESLLCTGFLLVFAPQIVGLYGISDPVIVEYAVYGLRALAITLIFTCRMFLDSSYFILVDRVSLGVLDSLLRELLPALPLAIIGGLLGGALGMFIGLMLAAPLGYILSVLYVRCRYGRENYPLFLASKEKEKRVDMFEFCISPNSIILVRNRIGDMLKNNACPDTKTNRAMIIFEELFMLIYERNPGKRVMAECAVEIGETIRLITKDNGQIVDLTNADQKVSSLRTYVLSNLLETHTTRRIHLLALSYNHNALEIR